MSETPNEITQDQEPVAPPEPEVAAPTAEAPAPAPEAEAPAPAAETPAPPVSEAKASAAQGSPAPAREPRPPKERSGPPPEKGGNREPRERRDPRGPKPEARADRPADRPGDRGGDRGPKPNRGDRDRGRDGGRDRRPEPPTDIDIEKLINDSLYLDNQAHAIVARMRDMDSGTRSQLRRLYSAVRRACRATETDRQHQFVMLRARLAYTIARHQLRSLDAVERVLLQVTRKNDAKGYERFRDLFEAIIAYNE